MRGKEERGGAALQDFGLEEAAEFEGAEDVEAAGGLVEQKNMGLVDECANQTEALDGAGRKGTNLSRERFREAELFSKKGNALLRGTGGELIEARKEQKILAGGEAGIKSVVGASVIAEASAHLGGLRARIESGDASATMRGKKQRGKNAEKR